MHVADTTFFHHVRLGPSALHTNILEKAASSATVASIEVVSPAQVVAKIREDLDPSVYFVVHSILVCDEASAAGRFIFYSVLGCSGPCGTQLVVPLVRVSTTLVKKTVIPSEASSFAASSHIQAKYSARVHHDAVLQDRCGLHLPATTSMWAPGS